jgi:hypothetical protein
MSAEDDTDETTDPAAQRKPRGVHFFLGCDVQVDEVSYELDDEGARILGTGVMTLLLRTDMWRFWLREAIDAAVLATAVSDQIPPLYEQFEADKATGEDLDELAIRELLASMRAITASAFAIDAFYAAVKARSPQHPHQEAWYRNKTARPTQVAETIIHNLRLVDPEAKKKIREWSKEIYRLRDLAVHPASEFQKPVYRPDLNVGVDQKFAIFRRENALQVTSATMAMFDYFVLFLDKASEELARQKDSARQHLDELLDRYDAANLVPRVVREEPRQESGTE